MGELISVRLPAETHEMLEKLAKEEAKDKSELVRELLALGIKEKRLERAIELYKKGKVTLWKAARIADVSLWRMIEIMREKKVEAQYGVKELEEDLKALKEFT
jgi:predicted HTH domain antitoxin